MLKLNLGCGTNKIEGFINIDGNPDVKPDLVTNIFKLPYQEKECDEVVLYHTIEHIPKHLHYDLIAEINRVLCVGGKFSISFPEFSECAKRWIEKEGGSREFWEATIYGRRLNPLDCHVCAMDKEEVRELLICTGFRVNYLGIESTREPFNTLIKAEKEFHTWALEDPLLQEVWGMDDAVRN